MLSQGIQECHNQWVTPPQVMPEIPVDAQIFDVVFHPTFSTVYVGLLNGRVESHAYDRKGGHQNVFSLRPSKRSCRGLSINEDGSKLYAVGKSKALYTIDTKTEQLESRTGAHEYTINRVKHLMPWLLSTGDDEGVIKLWDSRQKEPVRTYDHHFDYISDFLWLEDKKQLVATSADGTLSVMDVRSKKPKPIARSEDQEDELLSIVAVKRASKIIMGTQVGILSVFNRSSGWGDCVDRIPGHPMSVDALCNIPPDFPEVDTTSTILTGSSDGYVRAVQILPTKLLGVVADHGDWPVERIAVGGGIGELSLSTNEEEEWHGIKGVLEETGRDATASDDESDENGDACQSVGRWWVGSVGHEDGLRLTDLMSFFRDRKSSRQVLEDEITDASDVENGQSEAYGQSHAQVSDFKVEAPESDDASDNQQIVKRKRSQAGDQTDTKRKKGKKNVVEIEDASFFRDL